MTEPFSFDIVAPHFDDMAHRHIPHYASLGEYIKQILFHHGQRGRDEDCLTRELFEDNGGGGVSVLDLGCSTANMMVAAIDGFDFSGNEGSLSIIGCDVSQPMVDISLKRVSGRAKVFRLDALSLLKKTPDDSVDFVFINYVLQFIQELSERQEILNETRRVLKSDGSLILSEKHRGDSETLDKINDSIYYAMRLKNGDTPSEIEKKNQRLSSVMKPVSERECFAMLLKAKFTRVNTLTSFGGFNQYLVELR